MSEQIFTNLTVGGPVFVHVKDGRIVRVRPIRLDESDPEAWTIEVNGKTFSPPRKTTLSPYVLAERNRVYSDDRVAYPRKRVDFDPNGDRHPENRGKSPYVRISWDEALDVVSKEIKRVQHTYGQAAISALTSSHHNWGNVGYKRSAFGRFFYLLGFTDVFDNPDSWEGWHWGSIHTYGYYWRLGCPEQYDLLEDTMKNSELLVFWSHDPDSTRAGYSAQESAIWRVWLKELGKKQIFIDPYFNSTAVTMADKWIAPRPGTDAALAEAIAYVWIKDGTYDKEYIATHTMGFDNFKDHILGKTDKIPKNPKWGEEKCDIPARVITALAREWASKRTALAAGTRGGWGGACRAAYATEWARLSMLLQAMQGLGKPGVSIWGTTTGAPYNSEFDFPGYASNGYGMNNLAKKPAENSVTQRIYRLLLPEAVLNPPIQWLGEGFCGSSLEQQFKPYVYPEKGKSEVKMFYRYGGSYIGTMTETNRFVRMYQSPKLEFVVNQEIWWNTETRFADVILPACTNFERNDIGEWANSGGYSHNSSDVCNHRIIVYQQKAIEPLYESKPDYWILAQLADRLGFKEDFTEGNETEEGWIKKMFDASSLPKYISFEEFKTKGYFVVPYAKDYKSTPALRWFYEGRPCDTADNNPNKKKVDKEKDLGTYSGKIEFVAQSLKKHFPNDKERPPMPRYIPSWEGHETKLAQKYPLQLISPHPRFSFHTHHDTGGAWLVDIPNHRIQKDGYYWRPVRIHTSDAEARGIKEKDIVKLYNDRGAVLCIALVTERMKPGTVHCYESSGVYDPLEPGKAGSTDKGGCINILTPARMISKNAPGMANNSCLIEIEKWEE
jgi:molybdopterin guanine dinucleotide-containing S/N-oxide reductase-like protein